MVIALLTSYVTGVIVAGTVKVDDTDVAIVEHAAAVLLWPITLLGILAVGLYHLARRARRHLQ